MSKRILTFGAVAMILAAALVAVLAVLDVITFRDARESLGKTVSVIAIVTGAVVLITALATYGKGDAPKD